jgi:ABC-type transport system involved in multi-copper enzyme maturation permease subunit
MAEEEFCSKCAQKHDCKAVYEHLGRSGGPSVVPGVLKAFLLPICVLIVGLSLFEELLFSVISNEKTRTAMSFLLALGLSFVFVLIVKAIGSLSTGAKDSGVLEGDQDQS